MARDRVFETVVITAAIVFFVGLVFGLFLFDFFTPAKMEHLLGACAWEGEQIGGQDMPESCCQGFSPIQAWPRNYQGDCSDTDLLSEFSVCSNCGDEICNPNTYENPCSCPEDCP